MDAREALGQYRQIREVTQHMLAAARAGDWEALVNLEVGRKAAIEAITSQSIDYQAAGLVAEKDACIRSIMDADRQIRTLTEAWMNEMRETLASIRSQRRLQSAYGTG